MLYTIIYAQILTSSLFTRFINWMSGGRFTRLKKANVSLFCQYRSVAEELEQVKESKAKLEAVTVQLIDCYDELAEAYLVIREFYQAVKPVVEKHPELMKTLMDAITKADEEELEVDFDDCDKSEKVYDV